MTAHRPQLYRSARPAGHNGRTDPKFDEQGGTRLAGAIGSKTVRHHRRVRLVLYPGEGVRNFVVSRQGKRISLSENHWETTFGHIYVIGGRGEAYEAVGGPPPGHGHPDAGGHVAGRTPAGLYTLGPQEHHTTLGWPYSTIPYGAKLRVGEDGFVEYLDQGSWKKANGPHGIWTKATQRFHERDGAPPLVTEDDLSGFHSAAYDRAGNLRPEWLLNDFGEWAWNLMRDGKRSAYYIHTTPQDEYFKRVPAEEDAIFSLIGQSHGCVHILPRDRDEMMERGYLKKGIHVQVMPYGRKGPANR